MNAQLSGQSKFDRQQLRAFAAGKPPLTAPTDYFVGRDAELVLFGQDLEELQSGAGTLRILVGESGAGKSALLRKVADVARRRRFVTMSAELSPDRLLHGRSGEARALLQDLVMSVRTVGSSNAIALDSLVARFRDRCEAEAERTNRRLVDVARECLAPLQFQQRGADFAEVMLGYALSLESSSQEVISRSRQWLSAQYASAAEARERLRVSSFVADVDLWPLLKLWGRFAQIAGTAGLLLCIDELRALTALHNHRARVLNYEQLFTIYNEIFEGMAPGVGLILAGTAGALNQDTHGLCSHRGLASCLQEGKPVTGADALIGGVVIRIADLAEAELVQLLKRIRALLASCHPAARLIPEDDLPDFLSELRDRLGGQTFRLPREVIQEFLGLHNRMHANPSLEWRDLLRSVPKSSVGPAAFAVASSDFAERSI